MPAWGKRKSEEAPQSQGRRAVRQAVAEGGSEREVLRRLVDVLTTLSLVNAAALRDLTSTVFKTYLVPSTENVAEAMAEGRSTLPRLRWRNQEQARSRASRRSRATRSRFRVRVGSVPAQLGLDEGVGSRTRGSSETVLGEQRVEESASAVGIPRPVVQSEVMERRAVHALSWCAPSWQNKTYVVRTQKCLDDSVAHFIIFVNGSKKGLHLSFFLSSSPRSDPSFIVDFNFFPSNSLSRCTAYSSKGLTMYRTAKPFLRELSKNGEEDTTAMLSRVMQLMSFSPFLHLVN